jgi:hypothetical protein
MFPVVTSIHVHPTYYTNFTSFPRLLQAPHISASVIPLSEHAVNSTYMVATVFCNFQYKVDDRMQVQTASADWS